MLVHESFVEGFVKSILRKDYVPPSVVSLVSSLKEIHSINQTNNVLVWAAVVNSVFFSFPETWRGDGKGIFNLIFN